MSKLLTREFWKKGSGTCFYGVLIMSAAMMMCFFIYSTFLSYYCAIVAQTRADIISDATAITLSNTDFTDGDIEKALSVANKLSSYNNKVLSSKLNLSQSSQFDKTRRTVTTRVDVISTALNYASDGSAHYARYSVVEVLNKATTYSTDFFDYPPDPRMPCTPMFSMTSLRGKDATSYWNCAAQFPLAEERYKSTEYNNDITLLRDIMAAYGNDGGVVLEWDTTEMVSHIVWIEIELPFGTIRIPQVETAEETVLIDNYYEYIDDYITDKEFGYEGKITAYHLASGTIEISGLTDAIIEKVNDNAENGHFTAILFSDGKIYIILPPTENMDKKSTFAYMCASEVVTEGRISKTTLNNYLRSIDGTCKIISIR